MGAWARKPLIARRASKAGKTENKVVSSSGEVQADVQPGEADDKEDDKAGMVCRFGVKPLLCCKVSQLAKQHDAVQSYKANEVPCVVLMSFPLVLPWLSLKRLL